ncbi:tyrosine-type recombinase/integrase [Paenarthrobacter ureafaciens]|uniref:tyrosine-type recombinase/integrase n=1 Tax=Paenarthrobacter ureafaciens TaxID=37931 RepID=UPI0009AC8046|nr:site-specific integrase [Paenarthrobacter ureafaciens]GLU58626.1 site-specific integrase [Paenarthrobacter ureafaciens]GLU61871.1 site-specific integrase [Paenarthrobacter ureafaciens]GLU66145.1 site-specific integrase [Paenarthrobacter ureafaciens]GLU71531.1 site-specific integrase [Paenarthrobacter ureafaciens]GLU74682.1 site-specific integrase [Paenarthrobacter ureafaciens]
MARLEDRWIRKKDRKRTADYGKGLRWRVVWDEGGAERKKSFPNKDLAVAFRDEKTAEEYQGTLGPNRDMTVGEMWPRYRGTKNNIGAGSQKAYDAAWALHIQARWADKRFRDVTAADVREWIPSLRTIHGKPLSAAYEGYLMGVMKALLEHAVEARVITTNPMAKVKRRKKKQAVRRYLTVAQADALMAAARAEDERLIAAGLCASVADTIMLMLRTGARRGEVAGVAAKHLYPRRYRLRVESDIDGDGEEDETKTGEHRDLPVRGEVLAMLKRRANGANRDDVLLPAPDGRPWTRHTWRHPWDRIRASTGIPDFDTHELRHTAVSWAIRAGANVKTVQRMVGHASAAMTLDVYGHLWDDQLDEVPVKVEEYVQSERARTPQELPDDEIAA